MDAAVAVVNTPLRMSFSIECRPSDRNIDRANNPDLVTSFDLRSQQIKVQMWVNLANLSRVIAPAVVALGKDIDLIDIAEA